MSLGKRVLEDEEEEDKETRLFGTGKLHRSEVERYSRQIMLPEVTSTGARALLDAKVLVVGAGGLGSSILLYLAAAGVGHIGVVDFDTVDRSNLHRQVAHTDDRVGVNKAVSAAQACLALNPTVHVEAIQEQFTELNGQALVNRFDVVIDATDNVAARYLVNDACALAEGGRRPLVSGSAMRWEGQLTVYNYEDGPCFRCVFPTPPPAATVGSCNDVGVIGAVPGTIGCMQALEAQKILIPGAAAEGGVLSGRMLFWDGLRGTFRVMKLRPRSATCFVCGTAVDDEHRITTITSVGTVYEAGACARPPQAGLDPRHRIAAKDAVPIVRAAVPTTVIIDVRESLQYNMCALPRSVPLPLADLDAAAKKATCAADGALALVASRLPSALPSGAELLVLCRRGIASVKATRLLVEEAAKFDAIADDGRVKLPGTDSVLRLRNIDGGLNGLTSAGLHEFPVY